MLSGELSFLWSNVFEDFSEHRNSSCLRLFKTLWLWGRLVVGFEGICGYCHSGFPLSLLHSASREWQQLGKFWESEPPCIFCVLTFFMPVEVYIMKVLVTQLCPTLCYSRDCSQPGSSVHGILQARMLEFVAIPFFRGSSWPRDWAGASQVLPRTEKLGRLQSMGWQRVKQDWATNTFTFTLKYMHIFIFARANFSKMSGSHESCEN